ncbi:MAG: hypothetical protein ACRD44_14365 [Bryobacteraceae bacterium]
MLAQMVVLPEKARALKIGGPNFNCYVESDGDQSNGFNGTNLEVGDPGLRYETAQLGMCRTEVEPAEPSTSTRFLNVLVPRLAEDRRNAPRVELADAGGSAHGVRVGDTIAVFSRDGRALRRVELGGGAER